MARRSRWDGDVVRRARQAGDVDVRCDPCGRLLQPKLTGRAAVLQDVAWATASAFRQPALLPMLQLELAQQQVTESREFSVRESLQEKVAQPRRVLRWP